MSSRPTAASTGPRPWCARLAGLVLTTSLVSVAVSDMIYPPQGVRNESGSARECLWGDRDLHHAVAPIGEEVVGLLDPREGKVVREQGRQVESPVADELHQPAHAFLATRTQRGDDGVVADAGAEGLVWNAELSRVDAEAGERSARSQAAQAGLEGALRAERLDGHVRSAAGELLHLAHHVGGAVVEHDVGAEPLRHRDARIVALHADDERRTHEPRPDGRAEPD